MQDTQYLNPTPGASLLLSFRLQSRTTLIIGSGKLAASRALSALEADSTVVVLASGGLDSACEELRWRAGQAQLTVLDWDACRGTAWQESEGDSGVLQSFLNSYDGDISFVCVTDTLIGTTDRRSKASNLQRVQQAFRTCSRVIQLMDKVVVLPLCCIHELIFIVLQQKELLLNNTRSRSPPLAFIRTESELHLGGPDHNLIRARSTESYLSHIEYSFLGPWFLADWQRPYYRQRSTHHG